ncbi:universal stress protein [uncultured Maritimibacter sp.]|jgi:nucleotide-binding universal stress UspA family protein|uniref:universal stress protein n=1 Tax=uncultured Maritimibacter sp. TaxID=991866 RepID=UPI002608D3C2|nr:universal stress protein [uncultured Maritimibacter sp.]
MKTLLVATDMSIRSDRAVQRALRIARERGAVCHILHVVDDALPGPLAETVLAGAAGHIDDFAASYGNGAVHETHVVHGDPRQIVPEMAASLAVDLLLLGIHRPRPILDALRETTMEAMVRTVSVPVLLVRDPADHDYTPVVIPVSFSPACAAAITAAKALAPEAEVTVYHSVHLPFSGLTMETLGGPMDRAMTSEAKMAAAKWSEKEGIDGDMVEFISGGLRETFFETINAKGAKLVALGAHTRSPVSIFTLGSFTSLVVRNPPCDLLIAHPA